MNKCLNESDFLPNSAVFELILLELQILPHAQTHVNLLMGCTRHNVKTNAHALAFWCWRQRLNYMREGERAFINQVKHAVKDWHQQLLKE